MQNWLDGPLTAAKGRGALGGDMDGMLTDFIVLQRAGTGGDSRSSQLSGSGHAALRRSDGMECAGRRRTQAGIDGAAFRARAACPSLRCNLRG